MLSKIYRFLDIFIRGITYGALIALIATMVYNYVYPGAVAYQRTVEGIPHFNITENGVQGYGLPMVRIHNEFNSFICSGSIISNNHILTAAHCLLDENKKLSKEIYNIHILDKNGVHLAVVKAKAASLNSLADYAIMSGDFTGYSTYKIAFDEVRPIQTSQNVWTCGYPWGADAVCYKITSKIKSYYFRSSAEGRLFPGMSGGPVIDVDQGLVVGVNSAVIDDKIIISPLVGLFESLEIEVDNE